MGKRRRRYLVIPGILALAAALIFSCNNSPSGQTPSGSAPSFSSSPSSNTPVSPAPIIPIAQNLQVPWSLAFLPDNSIIFTERPGRIRLINAQGQLLPEPLLTVSGVAATGEGGLLGLALHPDFDKNHFVYIYHTYQGGGGLLNRVIRFTMNGKQFSDQSTIIEDIPGGSNHDGGRIKFGPDGMLYITTGDAGNSNQAQDRGSLGGKILRLTGDGSIPGDNPFPDSPVYSYGHRNPEGLAWDSQGRLWATEHGSSANDEVNLIEAGNNYGWPVIQGTQTAPGMVSPVITSGGNITWAPAGAIVFENALYFTALRGASLFQLKLDDPVRVTALLQGTYGRLRNIEIGPDGFFYVLTSNRDGRGSPHVTDDQILKVDPKLFAGS